MPTPAKTIGQLCADRLKEEKAKAAAAGVFVSWEMVAAIIDQMVQPKPKASEVAAKCEAIYATYPRKVGKAAAVKAIARAAEQVTGQSDAYAYLLERTGLFAKAVAAWPDADRQYCPHPSTWFNQGRWMDDPKEWERGGAEQVPPVAKDYSKLQ